MGFREDFEKFRKPKEEVKESSKALLPSFNDVRVALRNIKVDPTTVKKPSLLEPKFPNTTLSAPTGKETPLPATFDFLKDKSTEKQGFKLSDFIIPEVRKGFNQSFGKAEQGTASDIYTEMIPAFGKNRAYDIAQAYQNGVDALGYPVGVTLSEAEKSQFDGWKQKHWALLTLDATDILGVGIALKAGASFISRTGLRRVVSTAAKQSNIKDIHAEILKQLPDLKGTQELEDVTEIIIAGREQNPDKLAQIVQKRVANTTRTPQAPFATEAQRIVYENGIPVVRKTTPDDLISRRATTLDALKGKSEALRLSNADVLQAEIRAGALPFKTTADDTIEVFRVAPRGRRIKAGEEVSFSEDFAKQLSEGAKPAKIEVNVSDLVRLPDGTYTFAPERLIKEAPILKYPTNISKQVVKDAVQKEADTVAEKLAKQKAEQKSTREAAKKAERELMKPVEEAKAKIKKLEEKPVQIKIKTQANVVKEVKRRVKELADVKKTTTKQIADVDKKLRAAKQEASLEHIKKMKKAKTKLQKQKEKIRYQNQLAKLTEKSKAEKAGLKVSEKQALSEVSTKSKGRVATIKKEGSASLKAAQKELRGSNGEVQAIFKKASETVTKTEPKIVTETVTKTITRSSKKESLKPVGEGVIRESNLYASTQARVRQIRKDLGETINSKEYEFYRQASNKDQLAKAATFIEENGVESTIKILETAFRTGGDAVPGVLNNSLMLALEPELLKAGMSKYAEQLLRLSSRMTTRFGQEIQILSVLDRNNPLRVLQRLQNNLDSLVGDTAIGDLTINVGARTKAEKVLNEIVAKIDIKGGVNTAIDDIIC